MDRFNYTFLLNRLQRDTPEGKLLLKAAQKLAASGEGKSGVALRALFRHGEYATGRTERDIVMKELKELKVPLSTDETTIRTKVQQIRDTHARLREPDDYLRRILFDALPSEMQVENGARDHLETTIDMDVAPHPPNPIVDTVYPRFHTVYTDPC